MKKRILLVLWVLGRLLPLTAQTNAALAEQLNQFFDYVYKEQMFNGGVAVKHKGLLIFSKGYGTANFETGTPFTPQTQTEIASVSKQFTAAAILILRNEGKLKLDDDINKYFHPALPFSGVTIKHLLTHTSGAPDYEKYFTANWNADSLVYNKDIIGYLYKEKPPLQFAPGSEYRYSNLGFVLLAEIVQATSAQTLDRFLAEKIFLPFGMKSTGFFKRADIFSHPGYGTGVLWNTDSAAYTRPEHVKGNAYVWFLSGRLGPGRLTSTVEDLLRWDSLLYTNAILPPQTWKEAFAPAVKMPGQAGYYGFGWRVLPHTEKGKVVFHMGDWPGNLTYIKRYIHEKSTVVILNNTYSPYMPAIRDAVDSILAGKPVHYPEKKLQH